MTTSLEAHLSRQVERSREFFWNRLRWRLILSRLPKGEAELVDVGAGPGFLGDLLRRRRPQIAYRYVEPIAGLERRLVERFGAAANRRDRDFDAAAYVTLMDVLEHQEDDRAFMEELAGKVTPGAMLLLTVPAMPWLWSGWDEMLGHHRRYTKAGLREVAAPLPFEVVEEAYLFPELIPLGLARRLRISGDAEDGAAAEFPDLPRALNEGLYRIGSVSLAMRRLWPAGTSLFAALRRV